MDGTVFKKVALGRIASNINVKTKEGGINHEVSVTPTEWLNKRDGELTDNPVAMTYKAQDAQGVEEQGGFLTNNAIPATWLPAGANRLTPPTVRRGMRVELFQTADEDKFYWRYLGLDDQYMLTETLIMGINAHSNEVKDGEIPTPNLAQMYWFEMSSQSKMIAMSTSKALGEPYQYEAYFDLGKGEFVVTDDVENYMHIDSAAHLVELHNQDGVFVRLDRKDLKGYAPNNIEGKADKDIKLDAGKNIKLTAGQDIDLNAQQNCRMKGGVLASIDGGGSTMTFTAGGTVWKTPDVEVIL